MQEMPIAQCHAILITVLEVVHAYVPGCLQSPMKAFFVVLHCKISCPKTVSKAQ